MSEKVKSVLCYLLGCLVSLIILLACNDNTRNTKFHACQAIVISVASVAISIISGFISYSYIGAIIGFAGSIFCFVLMIMGIVKVIKEEENPELPIVGDLTKSIFASQIDG